SSTRRVSEGTVSARSRAPPAPSAAHAPSRQATEKRAAHRGDVARERLDASLWARAGRLSTSRTQAEQILAASGPRRQRLWRSELVLLLRTHCGLRVGMKVLVLGAGVIGTTTAWFLREAGHEVTVIERQSAAAQETSFANGGQISVSHVEPWANPEAPFKILRWLSQPDAPLLFRPRLDWHQWRWGAQFLIECLPWRMRHNMLQILAISKYSGEILRELRRETGLHYDDLQRG